MGEKEICINRYVYLSLGLRGGKNEIMFILVGLENCYLYLLIFV